MLYPKIQKFSVIFILKNCLDYFEVLDFISNSAMNKSVIFDSG